MVELVYLHQDHIRGPLKLTKKKVNFLPTTCDLESRYALIDIQLGLKEKIHRSNAIVLNRIEPYLNKSKMHCGLSYFD